MSSRMVLSDGHLFIPGDTNMASHRFLKPLRSRALLTSWAEAF